MQLLQNLHSQQFKFTLNLILLYGVIAKMLAQASLQIVSLSSAQVKPKTSNIVICCFSAKHSAIRLRGKTGWLQIRIMCLKRLTYLPVYCCLVSQYYRSPTKCVGLVQRVIIISSICNLQLSLTEITILQTRRLVAVLAVDKKCQQRKWLITIFFLATFACDQSHI